MDIPCAKPLPFLIAELFFLKPELTNIQLDNMLLVATALVLSSGFNLTRISRLWLEEKVVGTLSYFLSDAKFYVPELQLLYSKRIPKMYKLKPSRYLVDKVQKVLYHTKTKTLRLNSIAWHRVVESIDPPLKPRIIITPIDSIGKPVKFSVNTATAG
jgi:hypothetical protein